jgi:hypothetical protein
LQAHLCTRNQSHIQKTQTQRTVAAYGVNPSLIWHTDTQTYASSRDNARALYAECLGPVLQMLQQRINSFLLPMVGADPDLTYVEFDLTEKLKGSFEERASILQAAVGGTQNAAVAKGVFHLGADYGNTVVLFAVVTVRFFNQVGRNKGGVAAKDKNIPASVFLQKFTGTHYGMAGAQTFGLQCGFAVPGQCGNNLFGSGTQHNTNILHSGTEAGIGDPGDHGAEQNLTHHLGVFAFHTLAVACGKNQRTVLSHKNPLLSPIFILCLLWQFFYRFSSDYSPNWIVFGKQGENIF